MHARLKRIIKDGRAHEWERMRYDLGSGKVMAKPPIVTLAIAKIGVHPEKRERQSLLTLSRSAIFMNECSNAKESFVIQQRRTFLSSSSLHSRLLVRCSKLANVLRRRRGDERSRASLHLQPFRWRDFGRPAEPLTHLAISRICRSLIEQVARRRRFHERIDTNSETRKEQTTEEMNLDNCALCLLKSIAALLMANLSV